MTLSPKQKEVIRLMREGWELAGNRYVTSQRWALWSNGVWVVGKRKKMHGKIISTMTHKGLIKVNMVTLPFTIYTLTDLGKTIEI